MDSVLIAGFSSSEEAIRATGRLTDQGALRHDLSLVTPDPQGRHYQLTGDGVLAARLRLAEGGASMRESLQWIGLDEERAEVLESLLDGGGGLIVLALPSGELSAERGRATLQEERPATLTTVKIMSSGSVEEPALRVHTSVGTEPQSLSEHTLREQIAVERRTVRRHANQADLRFFQDATYEFSETTQVLEVHTVPYVVEELVVNVHRSLEEHEVEQKVRSMRMEIEEL